jgi:hypothetical protein
VFVPGKPFQPSLLFVGKQEPTLLEHLSGGLLKDRLLALPANNRAGNACQGQTNTSFLRKFVNYEQKKFKTLAPGVNFIELGQLLSLILWQNKLEYSLFVALV